MIKPRVNYRLIFDRCIFCLSTCSSKPQYPVSAPQASINICPGCLKDLPWLDQKCGRCALPLPEEAHSLICGQCLAHPPTYHKADALFYYRFPIDHVISRIKYQRTTYFIGAMANLMAKFLRFPNSIEALIPIPMHKHKQFRRGFNQAELLAQRLSQLTGIPTDTNILVKTTSTPPQMGLSRKERLKNQRGSLICKKNTYQHVVLIDDVLTTGATMETASEALTKTGISTIDVMVIARTDKD